MHVGDRAPRPTDTDAPGLKIPTGQLSFKIGDQTITITAADWNTIVASSRVPALVTVTLDPYFRPNATSRQRFQYLADLVEQANGSDFDVYGLGSYPDASEVITLGAWVNSASQALKMTSLTLKVTDAHGTLESSGTFYTSSGHSIVIPAHGLYLARLSTPLITRVPNPYQTTTSFTYKVVFINGNSC